jgi:hypothetical protein
MMWHFKQPDSHEPTAKAAQALDALEDHILRGQAMDEAEVAKHHKALHQAYAHLDPEDKAHLKMRLGVVGHQHALAEHEQKEAAAQSPDAAAEMAKLQAEIEVLRRKNAELSAGKRG